MNIDVKKWGLVCDAWKREGARMKILVMMEKREDSTITCIV